VEWLSENWVEVLGWALFIASEVISQNPKWKSNSVVQMAMEVARTVHAWKSKKPKLEVVKDEKDSSKVEVSTSDKPE